MSFIFGANQAINKWLLVQILFIKQGLEKLL